jgi:hypothetical protein
MADSPDDEDSVSEPVRSVIVTKLCRYVGIVATLYLLSPGLILFLGIQSNTKLGKKFDLIFAPLQYLYDHVAAVEHFYDWYLALFVE